MTIEYATVKDAKELLAIYTPYVEKTAISLELTAPTLEEFEQRIREITARFPYLKAVENGKIVGYAYAAPFKSRQAYDYSAEVSVYVLRYERGRGIGKMLYTALESLLRGMGITNVNACIAMPRGGSQYLDESSAKFHEAMGYTFAGRFHACANKFGEWFDMIWMEKYIADHPKNPKPVVFPEQK